MWYIQFILSECTLEPFIFRLLSFKVQFWAEFVSSIGQTCPMCPKGAPHFRLLFSSYAWPLQLIRRSLKVPSHLTILFCSVLFCPVLFHRKISCFTLPSLVLQVSCWYRQGRNLLQNTATAPLQHCSYHWDLLLCFSSRSRHVANWNPVHGGSQMKMNLMLSHSLSTAQFTLIPAEAM